MPFRQSFGGTVLRLRILQAQGGKQGGEKKKKKKGRRGGCEGKKLFGFEDTKFFPEKKRGRGEKKGGRNALLSVSQKEGGKGEEKRGKEREEGEAGRRFPHSLVIKGGGGKKKKKKKRGRGGRAKLLSFFSLEDERKGRGGATDNFYHSIHKGGKRGRERKMAYKAIKERGTTPFSRGVLCLSLSSL